MNAPSADDRFVISCLWRLLAQAQESVGRLGRDEEALHDFRVALRKLRVWLRAYSTPLGIPLNAMEPLSQLAEATNPARDLEVYVQWLEHHAHRLPPDSQCLPQMLQVPAHLRQQAIARIREEWPDIERALKHQLRLASPLSRRQAAEWLVHRTMPKRRKRLERITDLLRKGGLHGRERDRLLHRARIHLKHLRYLLMPFSTCDRHCRRAEKRFKELQDALGLYHDLCVFRERLREAEAEASSLEGLRRHLRKERRRQRRRAVELLLADDWRTSLAKAAQALLAAKDGA